MWIQLISPDSRGVYLALRKKRSDSQTHNFQACFSRANLIRIRTTKRNERQVCIIKAQFQTNFNAHPKYRVSRK